ncbi:3-hydroxyacyl-CoA dehydrogenase [Bailinhaonella thermotolerans]|uniref:3-hydroxyacyl-CoA dehydrogenase n=1 Tax=Bailinhaonella thermotolerans TaxID=1070861 RepID=A0A3A4ALU9_9ACTN|nr:3-hydroxyacyl-CoA dehydrogenase [Bailinhaonella thermotolerans]
MRRVAVVGTGVIGTSWAAYFLAKGLDVVAADPAPGAEDRLRAGVDAAWPALTRLGLAPDASLDRLTFVSEVRQAVAGADFVQENGPEREDLKAALIAELDEAAPPRTVIASSSSGFTPTRLQAMCARRPERVVVGHPFNPAHLIPLVEVVPASRTGFGGGGGSRTGSGGGGGEGVPWAAEAAYRFYEGVGKRPILLRRELPGHLANRLQAALWREAYSLVERGAASVADIDAAIAYGPGLRWALLGPLANQHLSGGAGGLAHVLAHLGPPTEKLMDDLGGTPRLTPELVSALVGGVNEELGHLDPVALVAQRDELLLDLLARKAAADSLP